jgi:hypothetical protein
MHLRFRGRTGDGEGREKREKREEEEKRGREAPGEKWKSEPG